MIRTVLFDLDGTLADTAPDLGYALNRVLEEAGRPTLAQSRIRPVASHGTIALLRLGFGIAPGETGFDRLRQRLLDIYLENIARETRLFPGMAEVLGTLEETGRLWGVVTNKPAFLTRPLLEALCIAERAATIVSGDTLPERKPHPAPMHLACTQSGSEPSECLYIGDAERDIQAGRNAGMRTLTALYGYIDESEQPIEWGADGVIERPEDVLNWLA